MSARAPEPQCRLVPHTSPPIRERVTAHSETILTASRRAGNNQVVARCETTERLSPNGFRFRDTGFSMSKIL